ncbi:ABC transporter ATP-binding protein [Enterococcus faecalis]|nr:ABC transporter ATP-binding protein [Enterococcus faecalis]UYX98858.1 ABC transporter ATP-binding protein [Enterococcus faecalis]UYY02081.1 ABC transporter ATP-binding protein [Enterococcus faecalis]
MIELDNISKRYGNNEVLKNVTLSIDKGKLISFVGPNGAGKSTLLKIIAGMAPVDEGTVHLAGTKVSNTFDVVGKVSFFLNDTILVDGLSGEEHLLLLNETQLQKAYELLAYYAVPEILKKKVGNYSLGMRQLLLIVLAVSLDTPIIIFDEVMNGLDPINRRKTIQLMKKLKKTKLVLVSSHQLYDVRDISDRIAFVYDKKVEIYSNKSELDLNQLYENLIEGEPMKFELLKSLKNKKNSILAIVFFLLCTLQLFSAMRMVGTFAINSENSIKENITILSEEIKTAKNDEQQASIDHKTKQFIQEYIASTEKILNLLEKQLDSLATKNYKTYWNLESKKKDILLNSQSVQGQDSLQERIRLENDQLLITELNKRKLDFETDLGLPIRAFPFLIGLCQFLSSVLVIILFIVLMGDSLSRDFENKSFYLYAPVLQGFKQLILKKNLSNTFLSFALLLGSAGLVFLVAGILNGFNTGDYPLIIGNEQLGYSTITVWELIFRFIPYYLMVIFFLSSFLTMISALVKKSLASIGIVIISYFGYTLVAQSELLTNVKKFIPYSYIDIFKVVTLQELQMPQNVYLVGFIILGACAMAFNYLTAVFLNNVKIFERM